MTIMVALFTTVPSSSSAVPWSVHQKPAMVLSGRPSGPYLMADLEGPLPLRAAVSPLHHQRWDAAAAPEGLSSTGILCFPPGHGQKRNLGGCCPHVDLGASRPLAHLTQVGPVLCLPGRVPGAWAADSGASAFRHGQMSRQTHSQTVSLQSL